MDKMALNKWKYRVKNINHEYECIFHADDNGVIFIYSISECRFAQNKFLRYNYDIAIFNYRRKSDSNIIKTKFGKCEYCDIKHILKMYIELPVKYIE